MEEIEKTEEIEKAEEMEEAEKKIDKRVYKIRPK